LPDEDEKQAEILREMKIQNTKYKIQALTSDE